MLEVQSTLDFLADLDLYKTERPFVFTPSQEFEEKVSTSEAVLNTVELDPEVVTLRDIRGQKDFSLSESGFELVRNESLATAKEFSEIEARDDYARQTEKFWMKHLNAEYVLTYNVKVSGTHYGLGFIILNNRAASQ